MTQVFALSNEYNSNDLVTIEIMNKGNTIIENLIHMLKDTENELEISQSGESDLEDQLEDARDTIKRAIEIMKDCKDSLALQDSKELSDANILLDLDNFITKHG
jgi:sugar-specific transcriptional regulator TrmB